MNQEHVFMLQEFTARKEQVLNLETRLFVLCIVFQALFVLLYVFSREKLKENRAGALAALSSTLFLFFKAVAVNGKMVVVSMYLQQMEGYLAKLGYVGAVWETRALERVIFPFGNAFTLPATLAMLLLVAQTSYSVWFTATCVTQAPRKRYW